MPAPPLAAAALVAATVAAVAWEAGSSEEVAAEALGVAECVRWHRPGRILFYKDTAVHPVGISLPSELVARTVPAKPEGLPTVARFAGSRAGGDTNEYAFGPLDEEAYHAWYAQHRFALTRRKGGWDALRHAEVLAAGSVPLFEQLAEAPPYAIPFVPVELLLKAEQELVDYSSHLEAAYNATVEALLAHTRRCLTAEAMAAHVLGTMGLWPPAVGEPLRVLYVSCGWGWSGAVNDGWQGPVSIGLFIGLQRLLASLPNGLGRLVDAPPLPGANWTPVEDFAPTYLWYTYQREGEAGEAGAEAVSEEEARRLMYGFGFSYARRLPRALMATEEERRSVVDDIHRRVFDAVIFGKVGPAQGCEPLPYFDEVQAAGYPPQRVALIYGGDFGLHFGNTSRHVRLLGSFGTVFVRELDADASIFQSRPASVLPAACCMENEWRLFFKLWSMRLECWGCADIDAPVLDQLWPLLREAARSAAANSTGPLFGAAAGGSGRRSLGGRDAPCWSGSVLLTFPLLARPAGSGGGSAVDLAEGCRFATARLSAATRRLFGAAATLKAAEEDFLEAFGVRFSEVRAFICDACGGAACRHGPGLPRLAPPGAASGAFSAQFSAERAGRVPLAALRAAGWGGAAAAA